MTSFTAATSAQLHRWMLRMRREPFSVGFALAQPLMIFLFLGSSFENLARGDVSGPSYRAFLLGGVLALTVFGNSIAGGIPLLFDKEGGFLARCLVAPVARSSIFVARFLAVNLVSAIQTLILLALALAFGIHVETGAAGIVMIVLIGWLLGLGATVLSLSLVFVLRGHADFFALVGTITLPLAFVSTAFVPLQAMPVWMQWPARLNPLSYAVDGMRALIVSPAIDLGPLATVALALLAFDAVMLGAGVWVLNRRLASA